MNSCGDCNVNNNCCSCDIPNCCNNICSPIFYPTGITGPTGPTGPTGATGPQGDVGMSERITVGKVITTDSNYNARIVERKNGLEHILDFIIPKGKDGEKGEIVIRIGNKKPIGLFKEYNRDPELTNRAWHDGIYHTGDMAWRDEDGYYWFVGRMDDIIKSSGYRIGPFEVESALMTHPAVVECAITGVPDDIRGMVVKATVVLGQEWKDRASEDLIKELQQHVKHETAPYKYPRIVEFVDELPKTISGKIRRVEIREKDTQQL